MIVADPQHVRNRMFNGQDESAIVASMGVPGTHGSLDVFRLKQLSVCLVMRKAGDAGVKPGLLGESCL